MFSPDKKNKGKLHRSLLSLGPRRNAAPAATLPEDDGARASPGRSGPKPNPLLAALASLPEASPAPRATPAPTLRATPAPTRRSARDETAARPIPPAAPTPVGEAAAQPAPMTPDPYPERVADDRYWRPLIDPAKVIGGIVRSRYLILALTVAGAAIGVGVALSTPKKYEAVAEVLVDPRDIKIGDRQITESGLPSDATLAIVENQVRVMTSGTVLRSVVDKLNLTADPEFNGTAGGGVGIGSIVAKIRGLISGGSDDGAGDMRRALAIRNLGRALEVERGGKTFVVNVRVKSEDPRKSALIANTVTSSFLESYGEIQSGTAGRAADELNSRLSELQSGLEQAERKVEAFKAENDLIDAQGRLISDDEIVKLNEQLSVARARTIELNARAESARNIDLDSVVGGELPEQIASPVMAELRTQFATSKQELERMSARLGPRHPERIAAEAQLGGARQSMEAELRRIVSSIQVDLRRAVKLEQDLAGRLAQLKARQGAVSDKLVTLREMERDATAKRAVYESYLLRARETGEARGINTANVSVISEAYPPMDPLGPSRSMTVLAATMLGFMAGIGLGAVRGAVDSLRDGQPSRPSRPARQAPRPAPGRQPMASSDEISRILDDAARRSAAMPEPAPNPPARPAHASYVPNRPAAPQAAPQPAPAHDPQADAMRHWYEQQAALAAQHHALNQVAAQQGWPPVSWPYGQPLPPMDPASPRMPPAWPPYQPHPWQGWGPPPNWPPAPAASDAQRGADGEGGKTNPSRADASPVDEIRESLREFREAVRELAERRGRNVDW